VLTEGFKFSGKPKIEVFRSEVHQELLGKPEELVAIASDIAWDIGVPCYDINDVDGVVREVLRYMKNFRALRAVPEN
jgi:molybdopterin-guanine dinucleotide biosynthesis protein B